MEKYGEILRFGFKEEIKLLRFIISLAANKLHKWPQLISHSISENLASV